jgi:serine/threonine protein kinase
MKQICLRCRRAAANQNLFCPELDCPAERAPAVLEQGDWLEDFEILHLAVLLRTSALYRARRDSQLYLLKLAHPGISNGERLVREAEFLQDLDSDLPHRGLLPQVCPPYGRAVSDAKPYGSTTLSEYLLHYTVFAFRDAISLQQLLQQRSPLWLQDAGHIALQLTDVLQLLHREGKLHLALTPESILVRFDKHNIPRVLLWDLGSVLPSDGTPVRSQPGTLSDFVSPAYLAPELLGEQCQPGQSSDVYALGLIIFEMVVGRPMYAQGLWSDAEVMRKVRLGARTHMLQSAAIDGLPETLMQATEPLADKRYPSVDTLRSRLLQILIDDVPPEQHGTQLAHWLDSPQTRMWLVAAAVIFLLIWLALWMSESKTTWQDLLEVFALS